MLATTLIIVSLLTAESTEPPPVEFRCDSLKVDSGPGQSSCKGNVVVVRGPVLMCCDNFKAQADEDWKWETFTCSGNVRAQRFNEFVWSDRATFLFEQSLITLTGKPILRRGRSLMTGKLVKIDLQNDQAHVSSPRGRIMEEAQLDKSLVEPPRLSSKCPLPPKPSY